MVTKKQVAVKVSSFLLEPFFIREPQSPINPGVDLKINRSLQITFTLVFHPPSLSLTSFPCCIEIGFFVALLVSCSFFLPIAGTGFLSSMLHGRPRQSEILFIPTDLFLTDYSSLRQHLYLFGPTWIVNLSQHLSN